MSSWNPEVWDSFVSSFLRARIAHYELIITDGYLDVNKLVELSGKHAGTLPATVEVADACDEISEIHSGISTDLSAFLGLGHDIFSSPEKSSRPLLAYQLPGGFLSYDVSRADRPEFYIFDEQKRLLNRSFFGVCPFIEPECFVHFHRPVLFADDFFVRFNIAHLVFDKAPRVHLAKELFDTSKAFLFAESDYAAWLLSLFGVEAVSGPNRGTFSFERLVWFSDSFHGLSHPLNNGSPAARRYLAELRDRVAESDGTSIDRHELVWTSRQGSGSREIKNWNEVEKLLCDRGFEIVDPGDMSPLRQAKFFASCNVIGGVHGAGLTNCAFIRSEGTVLEVLPSSATTTYSEASLHLGHSYVPLVASMGSGDGAVSLEGRAAHRRDVRIDLELLSSAIDKSVQRVQRM